MRTGQTLSTWIYYVLPMGIFVAFTDRRLGLLVIASPE